MSLAQQTNESTPPSEPRPKAAKRRHIEPPTNPVAADIASRPKRKVSDGIGNAASLARVVVAAAGDETVSRYDLYVAIDFLGITITAAQAMAAEHEEREHRATDAQVAAASDDEETEEDDGTEEEAVPAKPIDLVPTPQANTVVEMTKSVLANAEATIAKLHADLAYCSQGCADSSDWLNLIHLVHSLSCDLDEIRSNLGLEEEVS